MSSIITSARKALYNFVYPTALGTKQYEDALTARDKQQTAFIDLNEKEVKHLSKKVINSNWDLAKNITKSFAGTAIRVAAATVAADAAIAGVGTGLAFVVRNWSANAAEHVLLMTYFSTFMLTVFSSYYIPGVLILGGSKAGAKLDSKIAQKILKEGTRPPCRIAGFLKARPNTP